MIATSVKFPVQQVKCLLRVFVCVFPLCAIIESSSTFMINESKYTLAPDEYTEVIKLKHIFPHFNFSPNSLSIFLSFEKENQANIPEVEKINVFKGIIKMRFSTNIT
jgi:hypothetical protein